MRSSSSEAHSETAQRMVGCHFDHVQLSMIQFKEPGSPNREAPGEEIGLFAVSLPLWQFESASGLGATGNA